jgi:hypothetical protein
VQQLEAHARVLGVLAERGIEPERGHAELGFKEHRQQQLFHELYQQRQATQAAESARKATKEAQAAFDKVVSDGTITQDSELYIQRQQLDQLLNSIDQKPQP